jgi:hypothetical protein
MANFLIGTVITVGTGLISSALAPNKKTFQSVDRNKQETFSEPRSSYGDYITKIWGRGRVSGILIYGTFPPKEEVSTSTSSQTTGGKGGGTTVTEEKTYSYYGDCAFMFSQEVQQNSLKELRLNGKLFWKDGQLNDKYASQGCSARFFEGTPTQSIDQFLGGVANQIPYRHRAYIVIERLPLADFGNGYPQASAIIQNREPKLSDIIQDICLESPNLSQTDIDVSDLSNINVLGFQVDNALSPQEKINQLSQVFFFDLIDSGDKLVFKKQYRAESLTYIPPGHLAAHVPGSEEGQPSKYKETRLDPTTLPTQYEIKYLDFDNNLLAAVERSPVFGEENINQVTIDYSGCLTANEAKRIVNQLLWLSWQRSYVQEFSLNLRYAVLEPGDVVEIEINQVRKMIQIKELGITTSNLVTIKSWQYQAQIFGFDYTSPSENIFTGTATKGSPISLGTIYGVTTVTSGQTTYTQGVDYSVNLTNGTITPLNGGSISNGTVVTITTSGPAIPKSTPLPTPSNTTLRVLDIPTAYDTDNKGLYVFGDGDSSWRNAAVYVSRNNQATFEFAGSLITRSVFGTCQTVLGGHTPLSSTDTTNTLDITIPSHAELATISQTDFELGVNRALVGNEILDFKTATLLGVTGQGGRNYRLSGLTRGLRGTYGRVNNHGGNETFYLLSGYRLILTGSQSDIGKTLYFKAVSAGQTLQDVSPVSLLIQGNAFEVTSPILSGFSPTQGGVSEQVKIFGQGLTDVTAVTVGGIAVTSFVINSDQQITATLASNTVTGKITVTSPGGTGQSTTEFLIIFDRFQFNIQSLSQDKQLTNNDFYHQHLAPTGTDRTIILPSNPTTKTSFEILHTGNGSLALNIKEIAQGDVKVKLSLVDQWRRVTIKYSGTQYDFAINGVYES